MRRSQFFSPALLCAQYLVLDFVLLQEFYKTTNKSINQITQSKTKNNNNSSSSSNHNNNFFFNLRKERNEKLRSLEKERDLSNSGELVRISEVRHFKGRKNGHVYVHGQQRHQRYYAYGARQHLPQQNHHSSPPPLHLPLFDLTTKRHTHSLSLM